METDLLQYNFFIKDKNSTNNNNNNNNNNQISKLKEKNYITTNEIKISNQIKKIPYFFIKFNVMLSYKLLRDLHKIPEIINKEDHEKYLLINYIDPNRDRSLYLRDFFTNLPNPKQVILHSIKTYLHLLKSLILLENNKITFFDLSPYTIFIENNKPMLQNFENSILNEHIDEKYISVIIKNLKDFTYKPLEIHLLFYLIVNDIDSLSYSLSYEIYEHFIENMTVLNIFSQDYREKYKKECIEFLNNYVNKSREQIIKDIIQYYYTWDNYSLSILYLHIFGNLLHVFSLEDTFINKIVNSLSKNISIHPSKRERLQQSIDAFNTLFYEPNLDWTYVNSIPQDKVDLLHEVL